MTDTDPPVESSAEEVQSIRAVAASEREISSIAMDLRGFLISLAFIAVFIFVIVAATAAVLGLLAGREQAALAQDADGRSNCNILNTKANNQLELAVTREIDLIAKLILANTEPGSPEDVRLRGDLKEASDAVVEADRNLREVEIYVLGTIREINAGKDVKCTERP